MAFRLALQRLERHLLRLDRRHGALIYWEALCLGAYDGDVSELPRLAHMLRPLEFAA